MKLFQTLESLHREIRLKAVEYFNVTSVIHIRVYDNWYGDSKYVVNISDGAGNSLGAAESFAQKDALRQALKAMENKAKDIATYWENLERSLKDTDDLWV